MTATTARNKLFSLKYTTNAQEGSNQPQNFHYKKTNLMVIFLQLAKQVVQSNMVNKHSSQALY